MSKLNSERFKEIVEIARKYDECGDDMEAIQKNLEDYVGEIKHLILKIENWELFQLTDEEIERAVDIIAVSIG